MPLGANKAAIMGVAGVSTGDVVLLSSQTATGDSEIEFTGLMTSTYGEYIFRFYNINPASDGGTSLNFGFQVNAVGGSGYDETITSAFFSAYHNEDNSAAVLEYNTTSDRAEQEIYQPLGDYIGSGSDESLAGELHLFNPSSTTYVKHFYGTTNAYRNIDRTDNHYNNGYINTTAAIDDINFKFDSGNFDGKIKMWGVK